VTVGKVKTKPIARNTPQQNTVQTKDATRNIPPSPNSGQAVANSGLKSFSLKNLAQKVQQPSTIVKKKAAKQVTEEPIDLSWNEGFNQEKLNEVWRRYTRSHEAFPRIHTIFKNHPPKLIDQSTLLMTLRNKTQEYELVKERANILSFLKRSLKNARIDLRFEIALDDKGPKKAFTVADKFKVMSEKNPALALFKKEFNLDLE